MGSSRPRAEFALFATAIGACAIAWRGEAVIATSLPETTAARLETRIRAKAPAAEAASAPPDVQRAIEAIQALLDGQKIDLGFIACDYGAIEPLRVGIYELTRQIQPGQTRTYGDLAADLGNKQLAQAVGQAMGHNPLPIIVPCHRVMGANGRLTGFSADGGIETKLRMLEIEGGLAAGDPGLFDRLPLAVKPGLPTRVRRRRAEEL